MADQSSKMAAAMIGSTLNSVKMLFREHLCVVAYCTTNLYTRISYVPVGWKGPWLLNYRKNDEALPGVWGNGRKRAFEPRHEKTNLLVSDLVQHKPGCTATEDG